MAQKLWEKSVQVNKDIERFTVGRDREMDLYLAKHDVLGSMAHITMLESIGLLTKEELRQLLAELKEIYAMAERGEFVIEEGVEDVHSQVELMLTRNLGDIGKKIHSGRSRNDQVLLDLKLFTRAEIKEVAEAVEQLFHVLVMQSERYKDVLMPGYTHLQIAMPSSFGLWFGAYAESLVDDMMFLQAAFKMCNRNPLGSAAGYGSSFPLNRTMTTRLLGFDSLNYNVVYAQMGRGKMERNVAFALASVAGTISKLAELMSMVYAPATEAGVLLVDKPVIPQVFQQSVQLAAATHNRLMTLNRENEQLLRKLDEIRLVDRAKCLLIEHERLTEAEAHRTIEKQAMDQRLPRARVAQLILDRYEL